MGADARTVKTVEKNSGAAADTRRQLLTKALGAGIVVAGAWAAGCGSDSGSEPVIAQGNDNGNGGSTQRDIDILNFALHLEYIDSEYYTYATEGRGIENFGVAVNGQGTLGATTGGARINFGDATLEAVARQLALDERAQVNFIRQTIQRLGGTPIAKPAIDLANPPRALGIDPTTPNGFLLATRGFEDTGVSAYNGTSRFLFNPDVIQGSARLATLEAQHAGGVRLLIAQRGLPTTTLDAKDVLPPPSGNLFFSAFDPTLPALAVSRTVREVLNIVLQNPTLANFRGGFLPNGLNSDPTGLLALA
jgi:hypothetical protein